jgi:hypothetical protein
MMPRLDRFVLAGFVSAIAVAAATPALAQRAISGAEAVKLLSGRSFQIACFNGTRGRGHFSDQGIVNISYKRSSSSVSSPEEKDRATVRVRGPELCISWTNFGGGGEGCYPVTEYGTGMYRIGGSTVWCDVKASQELNARAEAGKP